MKTSRGCRRMWRGSSPIASGLVLAVASVASSCGPHATPAPEPSRPPSVVYWLTIDSLRADTLDASRAGRPLMPALRELAKGAVVFDNAYAQSSFTKISVASMFTGLWPQRLGVKHCTIEVHPEGVELCFGLDFGFVTLAERLAAVGWTTISHPFTAHVRRGDGLLQGFQSQEVAHDRAPVLRQLLPWRAGAEHVRGRSVFVYQHLIGVHAPYRPSAAALGVLSVSPAAGIDPGSADWYTADVSIEQAQQLRASYDALAWDTDRRAAELLNGLKTTGSWGGALVIVTSDHGEEFLEHGRTQHSSQLYEEVVRVPLLVKFPEGSLEARFHGRRVSDRVRLVDIAPTVMHLVKGAEGQDFDGRSLLPLLRGDERSSPGRRVLAFLSSMRTMNGKQRLFEQHAILEGRFKALAGWRADSSQSGPPRRFERGDPIQELYDLGADSAERNNLAKEAVALWRSLARLAHDAAGNRPAMEGGPGRAAPPDPRERREIEERLRALGYLK